ncbi:hypothetical protein CkaCkLH20_12258 [Colletotrichum karsti]|uniref:Uncharacterized protein n=1 Tax=Colletotrichum karsti TaxID=1095194 RepID=A0A9P6HU52_9PEZI|nr:uncharacterized protein CkaCkLH20_12258 [Colletotrichum karsti]KAF9870294.1 hypothetical protein CkaCkLH20_12258 [Colletotrichum karsti]
MRCARSVTFGHGQVIRKQATPRQDRPAQPRPPPRDASTTVAPRPPPPPPAANAISTAVASRAPAAPLGSSQVRTTTTTNNTVRQHSSRTNIMNQNNNVYNTTIHATSRSESSTSRPGPDENPLPQPPSRWLAWVSPAWPWLNAALAVVKAVLGSCTKPLVIVCVVLLLVNFLATSIGNALSSSSTWIRALQIPAWLTYLPFLSRGDGNTEPSAQETPPGTTPVPPPATELTQTFSEGIRGAVAVHFTANEIWRHLARLASLEIAQPLLRPSPWPETRASANTLRQHSDDLRSATEQRQASVRRGMARLQRDLDMFPAQDAVPESGMLGRVVAAIVTRVKSLFLTPEQMLTEPWLTALRRLGTLHDLLAEARARLDEDMDKMQAWEVGTALRSVSVQSCAVAEEFNGELRGLDGHAVGQDPNETPDGTVEIFRNTVMQASRVSSFGCRVSREAQGWWGTRLEQARREHDWLAEEQDMVRSMMDSIRAGNEAKTTGQVEERMRDILRRWRGQADKCWGGDGLLPGTDLDC